jgi:hypothetical protein
MYTPQCITWIVPILASKKLLLGKYLVLSTLVRREERFVTIFRPCLPNMVKWKPSRFQKLSPLLSF